MPISPRIAIVIPSPGAYSETFINAHVDHLPGVVRVLVDGLLPRRLSTGESLMRGDRLGRVLDALIARSLGTGSKGLLQRRVARQLERDRVDVLLAEYGNTGVAMLPSSLRANVPLVVHFHGFDAHRTDVLADMDNYRALFEGAAAIVVVSRAMEAQLLSLGAPREKLFYNCYGIDVDRFTSGDPANAPARFVAVGRFVNKKAPLLTLEAFRLALEQRPQAHLTMVGSGPLMEGCAQVIKAFAIEEQVELAGVRTPEEIADLLRGARGFVQHSVRALNGDSEGTPLAVLEAMATGIPVIATRHAGIVDVVAHEERGLLCDEFDVRTMAGNFLRLIDDPALAGRLGRAGRAYVEQNHRVQDRIATLQGILERAATRS
ncbi:MAG TPA: glycosyltransferase [Flavobacteriales bacterium]|nr:glycosyltransferase [Flavobacteriales bacterium]